jgi:glycosyltransferase involved in cell wall biosynthesis
MNLARHRPPEPAPRRVVLHVITDLRVGGAEMMLHRLLQTAELKDYSHEVLSLTEVGPVGERLRRLGIATRALGLRRVPDPVRLIRLARYVKRMRPALVQTWMYHANLIGGLAAKLTRGVPVVWAIHSSALDPKTTHRTTLFVVALCAWLSRWLPDRIVAVSRTSRDHHVRTGYEARKFIVLPNGFDLQQYRPDSATRREARAELGVDEDQILIGLVARIDPVKDHLGFVRAAALLAKRHPGVRFLFCGDGTTPSNQELAFAIDQAALRDRFLLLGAREDVPRIMNALDIATLCSASGEAFPLVVGEAMACGVPCVVTDLGDCAHLVGDTGKVVPTRDPEALAGAWEELVRLGSLGRQGLGVRARTRIETHFSLKRVASDYAAIYRDLLGGTAQERHPPVTH